MDEIMYHGSIEAIKESKDDVRRADLDFGWGFYVTKYKKQAERWAKKKYERAKNNGIKNVKPTISFYHINRQMFEKFKYKYFVPSKEIAKNQEWFEFCLNSRLLEKHDYDIVEGPMLDSYVKDILKAYLEGSMGFEDLFLEASFNKDTHQIMFRKDALACLQYYDSEVIDDE